MNSIRGLLASVVVFVILAMAQCQLTFSPYWGKRSVGGNAGALEAQKGDCKNANEVLMDVFRYIQVQAQVFVDCNNKE